MKREIKAITHWSGSDTVGGLHLLGEWYGCDGPSLLLQDAEGHDYTTLLRQCKSSPTLVRSVGVERKARVRQELPGPM